MKHRPISIWIISAIYFLIAPLGVGYLLYSVGWDLRLFFRTVRWDLIAVLLSGSVVGYGVYKVRPWGYFAFLGYSSALVLGGAFRHFADPTAFSYISVIALIAGIGAIAGFIQKHFSAPYFNPQMRWWETSTRYDTTDINVEIDVDGAEVRGEISDISRTGCFITGPIRVVPGDIVRVRLNLLDYEFSTLCRVVRVSGVFEGYGLMYLDMNAKRKKQIRSIIRYLSQTREESRDVPVSA